MRKLHLGCGHVIKEGWVNHDIVNLPGVDVSCDLTQFPWPWKDTEFDEIYMKDVLEHLPDTIKTLEELYRICKSGAKIYIAVPYWNSFEAITDPTHVAQFNEFTFEFFDPTKSRYQKRPYYSKAKFTILKIGFRIRLFTPHLTIPIISRSYVVYNSFLQWIFLFAASYFNNIVMGLEVYLEKSKE